MCEFQMYDVLLLRQQFSISAVGIQLLRSITTFPPPPPPPPPPECTFWGPTRTIQIDFYLNDNLPGSFVRVFKRNRLKHDQNPVKIRESGQCT